MLELGELRTGDLERAGLRAQPRPHASSPSLREGESGSQTAALRCHVPCRVAHLEQRAGLSHVCCVGSCVTFFPSGWGEAWRSAFLAAGSVTQCTRILDTLALGTALVTCAVPVPGSGATFPPDTADTVAWLPGLLRNLMISP